MTLFEQIIELKNLYQAAKRAGRGKRYRDSILRFNYNLEQNIAILKRDLGSGTYRHGGYREFIVNDSKKRTIKAAPFRDRVVHHAICNAIEPIFERGFIYDSYACRAGRGTHKAILRLESFIRSLGFIERAACHSALDAESRIDNLSIKSDNRVSSGCFSAAQNKRHGFRIFLDYRKFRNDNKIYCLKCDIRKYFDNVDHETLFEILRKKISDEKVLWLLREIIASNPKGIPIGNLTSQLFANIYLSELDHFVKRELKERYYMRYMDDFLILGTDKKHLGEQKEKIRFFLKDKLKLDLHPKKSEISPIEKGLDFLGYVLRDDKRFLRRSTIKRFIKRRKRDAKLLALGKISKEFIESSEKSWLGYAKFGDSYGLRKKLGLFISQGQN